MKSCLKKNSSSNLQRKADKIASGNEKTVRFCNSKDTVIYETSSPRNYDQPTCSRCIEETPIVRKCKITFSDKRSNIINSRKLTSGHNLTKNTPSKSNRKTTKKSKLVSPTSILKNKTENRNLCHDNTDKNAGIPRDTQSEIDENVAGPSNIGRATSNGAVPKKPRCKPDNRKLIKACVKNLRHSKPKTQNEEATNNLSPQNFNETDAEDKNGNPGGILSRLSKSNKKFFSGASKMAGNLKKNIKENFRTMKNEFLHTSDHFFNNLFNSEADAPSLPEIDDLEFIFLNPRSKKSDSGLNAQERYKLKVQNPKTKIELLCSKCNFIRFNNPRKNKRLAVLDLDDTLCDFSGCTYAEIKAKRPHLEYFLSSIYEFYDIAIWSATNMDALLVKLKALNIIGIPNTKFDICFCLDITSAVTRNISGSGRAVSKPLIVIWELFQQFDMTNTVMIDDKVSNFYFNPNQGLQIVPYKKKNYLLDTELIKLSQYLCQVAFLGEDFSKMNHDQWKKRFNYNKMLK